MGFLVSSGLIFLFFSFSSFSPPSFFFLYVEEVSRSGNSLGELVGEKTGSLFCFVFVSFSKSSRIPTQHVLDPGGHTTWTAEQSPWPLTAGEVWPMRGNWRKSLLAGPSQRAGHQGFCLSTFWEAPPPIPILVGVCFVPLSSIARVSRLPPLPEWC